MKWEIIEISHIIYYPIVSIPFISGDLVIQVAFNNKSAFERRIDKTEIAIEDKSITNNYIYLPYQFYSNGTNKIGGMYSFNISGNTYEYKVKGYSNIVPFGCNNNGAFEFILIIISFLFALFESRRIKNIEPYKLLICE